MIELPGKKFEDVLGPMRAGHRFRRRIWPREWAWVSTAASGAALTVGVGKTATSGFYKPHLAMRSLTGGLSPWAPGVDDVMAEDWDEVT